MTVQQTSRLAYRSLTDLGQRQAAVLDVISHHQPISNFDIAAQLGVPVNQVTGRVKELRDKKLVVMADKATQSQTGRTVMRWMTVPQP